MAASPPVRFGVVGCGTIAWWTHLRLLPRLPGARLVAVADPSEAARARARTRSDARAYADPEELLASPDVDAVVIAAPSALHAPIALSAFRAGKHVYVEKPPALDAEEVRRMQAGAEASGVHAVVGFHRRLDPVYRRTRALVAGGAIGRVRAVQTVLAEPAPATGLPGWRRRRETGGGALLDLGVHHIDLLRWILAREPAVVACALDSVASEQDVALLHLRTDDGVSIQSALAFGAGPADTIELLGERGVLRIDRHRARIEARAPRRFGYGTRRRVVGSWRNVGRRLRHAVRPSIEPSFGYALAAFVRLVRETPAPGDDLASLSDGLRVLEIVADAEARSLADRA